MEAEEFCKKYYLDRRGTNSLKWDGLEGKFGNADLLSMWVADMDFKMPECMQQAVIHTMNSAPFGYPKGYPGVPDSYYDPFLKWQKTRHACILEKESIRFGAGVVPSILWLINTFTKIQDSVMILTPAYYPFFEVIENTNRRLVTCDLQNNQGVYSVDYERFEKSIVENNVKLFLQCSPHNPVSRVWTEEELIIVLEICRKHNVLVVSDEIHQDITPLGHKFISVLTVDNGSYRNNVIALNSLSKTFNLAGMVHSHIIICNEELRKQYDHYEETMLRFATNSLAAILTETAYREGEEWLESILELIKYNYTTAKDILTKGLPKVIVTELQATYLMWIDLREYISGSAQEFIQNECNLAVDYGEWFGTGFEGFIRINLATSTQNVEQAAQKIVSEIQKKL